MSSVEPSVVTGMLSEYPTVLVMAPTMNSMMVQSLADKL